MPVLPPSAPRRPSASRIVRPSRCRGPVSPGVPPRCAAARRRKARARLGAPDVPLASHGCLERVWRLAPFGTGNRRPMASKWWTLLAVCLAVFMLLLDITIVNVALPEIRRDLGASFTDLQWVVDAYALGLAALLLPAGSLGDLLGRRKVFVGGIALFAVASLLCGLSHTRRCSTGPRRAGRGRGDDVRDVACPDRPGVRAASAARRSAYGARRRASRSRSRTLVGRTHRGHRLGVDFLRERPNRDRDRSHDPHARARLRARSVERRRLGRARHLQRRALLPRVCPHPRQRRGLG